MAGRAFILWLAVLAVLTRSMAQNFGSFSNVNGTLVKCHTTALNGRAFIVEVKKDWAPLGAQRFLELVEAGFFTDCAFFRVVKDFLTQFGITPDRELRKYWRAQGTIADDPSQGRRFEKGFLSFAGGGENTRDTQLFIALADSDWLGKAAWEVPLGRVIQGMEVLEALYDGYGDIHPFGSGPDQQKIWTEGNEYLRREYPQLDYFKDCSIIPTGVKQLPKDPPAAAQLEAAAVPLAALSSAEAAGVAAGRRRAHEVVSDNLPPRPPPSWSTLVFVVASIMISVYFLNRLIRSPKTDKDSV